MSSPSEGPFKLRWFRERIRIAQRRWEYNCTIDAGEDHLAKVILLPRLEEEGNVAAPEREKYAHGPFCRKGRGDGDAEDSGVNGVAAVVEEHAEGRGGRGSPGLLPVHIVQRLVHENAYSRDEVVGLVDMRLV